MTRRRLTFVLAMVGIVAAILAVHTIDAPVRPDPLERPETATTAPVPAPEPAAVTHVSLPPPPALAAPTPEITPEITPLAAAETPARPITPMAAAPKTQSPAEPMPQPARAVEPLKPAPKPTPKAAAARPVEPLKAVPEPKAQENTTKEITETRDAAEPAPPMQVADKAVQAAGRPLLRLLEHGDGPSVEITWPRDRRARDTLHQLFQRCYGMRVAVLGADGRLYDTDSPRGTPWTINTDRFSGFIRQSSGGVPLAERQTVLRIRGRHGLDPRAAAVRVFPRRADALLLGGLSRLVGATYRKARRIQAAYGLAENRVHIEHIRVDGRPVAGAIDLSHAARRGCVL